MKPKRTYHVSRKFRREARRRIQETRPWEHSTGPRSEEGKRTTSGNALKLGDKHRVPEACPPELLSGLFARATFALHAAVWAHRESPTHGS